VVEKADVSVDSARRTTFAIDPISDGSFAVSRSLRDLGDSLIFQCMWTGNNRRLKTVDEPQAELSARYDYLDLVEGYTHLRHALGVSR
jgi:hypothetical protein